MSDSIYRDFMTDISDDDIALQQTLTKIAAAIIHIEKRLNIIEEQIND